MIIGVTGRAQHGKDSTGQVLVREFDFTRYAFADQLKSMALVLNPYISSEYTLRLYQLVQDQGWDEAKKNPEVRRFLQVLGTEAVRDHLGQDAWVEALDKRLNDDGLKRSDNIVITDVRFPNEAAYIHRNGGELWRVIRYESLGMTPFDNGLGDHPSEAFIDSLLADVEIPAITLEDLQEAVRELADARLSARS
jgi:hypothetical protein